MTAVLATLALASVGAVVWAQIRESPPPNSESREPRPGESERLGRRPKLPEASTLGRWYATGHSVGPVDAAVRIVEFGNYTCEFCRQLHKSFESLSQRYPDQIRIVWIHNAPPVEHPEYGTALDWAIASECAANQGAWEAFHRRAFARQAKVATRSAVRKLALDSGVRDLARFDACIDLAEPRDKIDQQTADAAAHRYDVTPTWIVNGHLVLGAPEFPELEELIQRALRPRQAH